jgi:hypothetical protein
MKRHILNSLTEILTMINRSTILAGLVVCVLLFAAPAVSLADTLVYSNFGPGNSYDFATGNIAGNDFAGDTLSEAATFTAGSTLQFSSLDIALSCFGAGLCPANFTVSLNSNSGGQPGAALESFTVNGATLQLLGSSNPPLLLSSVLHPTLTTGTQYWITVSATAADSVDWNWNTHGDASPELLSDGTGWYALGMPPGAYDVFGTPVTTAPVPEPSTLVLLGLTLLPLVGSRTFRASLRNRRNTQQS